MLYSSEKFTKLEWEIIERNQTTYGHDLIRRAKVHGGWLIESIKHQTERDGVGYGVGLTFIPDPNHEWKID